jgi:hypothetical protein
VPFALLNGRARCTDLVMLALCSAAERAFKAQSEHLMGNAAEAGDLAFGGEVQVESQVTTSDERPLATSILMCMHMTRT